MKSHTFTDNKGRAWTTRVTISSIIRAREFANLDLASAGTKTESDVLQLLATDPVLLAKTLYAVIRPQAEQQQVSFGDFADEMDGDALENATYALLESLADFFPKTRGDLLRKVIATAREQERKMTEKAAELIEDEDFAKALEQSMTPSPSPTASPESSD